jgi:hypothetical protein
MGKPTICSRKIIFDSDRELVWNVVTDNSDYRWRTEIEKIVIDKNGADWTEYYDREGKSFTRFFLRQKEPFSLYIFDMENKLFTGQWTGEFSEHPGGGTECVFTESITVKNPLIRVLIRFLRPFEKMQRRYIRDLQKKLSGGSI